MKKAIWTLLIIVVIGVVGFLLFPSRDVGEKLICETCGKTVSENIHKQFLPIWDKSGVVTKNIFCEKCGNEAVTITSGQKCRNCSKMYDYRQITAMRKDRKKDEITSTGFCSESCKWRTITIRQKCQWCSAIYTQFTKQVVFDSPEKDQITTQGFCSEGCHVRNSAQQGVNKGKEIAGDAVDKAGDLLKKGADWLKKK